MPQFYRPLGWGICGRQTFAQTMSRNLPQVSDGVVGGPGRVLARAALAPGRARRPDGPLRAPVCRGPPGSVVRTEEYWRWMIGRRYAHVIWVACQGEAVRGYAFIKDHKILEIAFDPAYPQALRALLGRVRAEALERAYPEVTVSAPSDHPVMESIRSGVRAGHRPGGVRRDGLDVPHPRPGPVLEGDPARARPPRGRVGVRAAAGAGDLRRTTSAG